MRMAKRFLMILATVFVTVFGTANAAIFSEDEKIQDGLDVVEMSRNFADIFGKARAKHHDS